MWTGDRMTCRSVTPWVGVTTWVGGHGEGSPHQAVTPWVGDRPCESVTTWSGLSHVSVG